jgi:putative ABC transport system permease protein
MVAVVLALVGLYGVMSTFVGARVREIGLRMALGADRSSILAMVMRRGFVLVAAGVAAGLLLTAFLTRLAVSMLYGVGAFDLPTFAGVALLLVLGGGFACWLPSRRAASVDPMVALRFEG